jgi:hypothetical protein
MRAGIIPRGVGAIRGFAFTSALPVRPNPSVKGTSCGKPQAAPYLER